MSTNDVPGSNPANKDVLAMGCWAEHEDGSLLFVDGTEDNRVIFSMFDTSKKPIVEYRHALTHENFKRQFSWRPESKRGKGDITSTEKWTWHDKHLFPWNRVIGEGAQAGIRYASATDQLTAAGRVAQSLDLRARELDERRARELDERRARRFAGGTPSAPTNRRARILEAFDSFRAVLVEELTANDQG